ncbi:hypothetical protein P7K49_002790 [Saguinus oedipus]|uniref:Uncharacterized protein n=1 Tax=Saguinus oedipus TaxID=9490 RepID=A0ABQ9WKB9_SAGOE|nr:hypothetical protein P7K49_002790 [Saguinus oedipus]
MDSGFGDNGGTGRSPSLPASADMVLEASPQLPPPPPQARKDHSPRRKRNVLPTAPREDQTTPGTVACPPTARPRPRGAAPPPGSGSAGALAPPSASGVPMT